jgi:hypothetical protein
MIVAHINCETSMKKRMAHIIIGGISRSFLYPSLEISRNS